MRTLDCGLYSRVGGLALLSMLGTLPGAHAATIQTVYHFDGNPRTPQSGVIADAAGNLYGVNGGGVDDWGYVYKLSPPAAGETAWHLTTLYSFPGTRMEGTFPIGTPALDAAGNLYGTGEGTGAFQNGFVYKLSPPQAGHTVWTKSVLYTFPYPGVNRSGENIIVDTNGHLYGFGQGDDGFVYELSPPAAGHTVWSKKIIHEFTGPDGASNRYDDAQYPLMIGAAGVLYGTTVSGGTLGATYGKGTVFSLTPPASGHTVWTEKVLYNVQGFTKGSYPTGPVIADSSGALYGGLASGLGGSGQIFKLSPPEAGHTVWTESTIFKFPEQQPYGIVPVGTLAFDNSGALYGETSGGGANNAGVVFRLTPPATGKGLWSETVLLSLAKFEGAMIVGLVADQNGDIFGMQSYSKSDNQSSVFEITP